MPWLTLPPRRTPSRQGAAAPLSTPLNRIDPAELEVIELDAGGRLAGLSPWKDDDSLHEVRYGPDRREPGSMAGVWEALGRS